MLRAARPAASARTPQCGGVETVNNAFSQQGIRPDHDKISTNFLLPP
jgi:hypothetical protein